MILAHFRDTEHPIRADLWYCNGEFLRNPLIGQVYKF
jgi:hypothetical protein